MKLLKEASVLHVVGVDENIQAYLNKNMKDNGFGSIYQDLAATKFYFQDSPL